LASARAAPRMRRPVPCPKELLVPRN